MPEISIGAAIGAGFDLIRTRPLAVWIWGLVNFALVAVTLLLVGMFMGPLMASAGGNPESLGRDPSQMIAQMMQMQGLNLLVSFGRFLVQAAVLAAVFRAVLQPDQSRWAYLRFGMAEMFLIMLIFAEAMAAGFAVLIVSLPFIFIVIAMAVAKSVAGAVIVGVIGVVIVFGGLTYLALRLALAGPMIVADNEFRFAESWRLTKGHVWRMFLTGLVMMAIVFGLELLLFAVLGGIGLGVLAVMVGGLSHIEELFKQGPAAILGTLTPIILVLGLVGSFVIGCFYAIAGAPWAHIYRQLAPPDPSKAFT